MQEIGSVQTLSGGRQRGDADLVRFGRYSFGPRWGNFSVCVWEILKICLDAHVHLEINQLWRINARSVPFLGCSMFISAACVNQEVVAKIANLIPTS